MYYVKLFIVQKWFFILFAKNNCRLQTLKRNGKLHFSKPQQTSCTWMVRLRLISILFYLLMAWIPCIMLFVSGNDLFLDSDIHIYLEAILKIYCQPNHLLRMDFHQPIPGLASFDDLWVHNTAFYSCSVIELKQKKNRTIVTMTFCRYP